MLAHPVPELAKSLTLLCVEDCSITQMILEDILKEHFETIIFAQNGLEGYQKFMDEKIDLIITDYQMPVCDGLEMIKKIRLIDHEIPIILVTGSDESKVLIQALRSNVTNFFLKPIDTQEVLNEVQKVSKVLAMNRYLKEKKEQRVHKLEKDFNYNAYQENLTLQKELAILRNDLFFQMIDLEHSFVSFEYLFKPLDTLSGDAFSARYISDDGIFLLLVDGMGKGISASFSAMLITAFINHTIDKNPHISLHDLVANSLEYIRVILLKDEILSVEFAFIDHLFENMQYVKFSMPATLLMLHDASIQKLKSNNPPISRFSKKFHLDEVSLKDVTKILLHSDGMSENSLLFAEKIYAEHLDENFSQAFSKDDIYENFLEHVAMQEDDITFIFLHQIAYTNALFAQRVFSSSFAELENASEWFMQHLSEHSKDQEILYKA